MDSLTLLTPIKPNKLMLTTPIKTHPPVVPSIDTPDRAAVNLPSRIREPESVLFKPALLPPKCEMMCQFFDAIVSSIRLLRLKRQPATLTKIGQSIESLTDRRFTMNDLAQLKRIMPEVIVVKKTRVLDRETSCMKEDLLISLDASAVETDNVSEGSVGFSHLKGIFRSRIIDYAATHSVDDDVPEGELPELFYKQKQEPEPSMKHPTTLMSPSFKRRFSSRVLGAPLQESSPAKVLPENPAKTATFAGFRDEYAMPTIATAATPVKVAATPLKYDTTPAEFACAPLQESFPVKVLPETPLKTATFAGVKDDHATPTIAIAATPVKVASTPSKYDTTPAKFASTPARLMTATPALRTPKRSLMTHDVAIGFSNKSGKRRALKFDKSCDDVEEQLCQVRSSPVSKDLLEVLPENLLHSLMEKERKTLREQDPFVSQAEKRQQLICGARKLFDTIQLLFQSSTRSMMTKEELIHKIITGHLDILDKGEVEEQLKLLQEIVPEFITEHSCLSGDTLIRHNKYSCAESIRAKLVEAE